MGSFWRFDKFRIRAELFNFTFNEGGQGAKFGTAQLKKERVYTHEAGKSKAIAGALSKVILSIELRNRGRSSWTIVVAEWVAFSPLSVP